MIKAIDRFVVVGRNSNKKIDAILYGVPDDFIWIKRKEIYNIFNGIGHSYNIPVIIKTKNKEYDTYLVDKTRDIVITIENEHIKIDDIISIEKKNWPKSIFY